MKRPATDGEPMLIGSDAAALCCWWGPLVGDAVASPVASGGPVPQAGMWRWGGCSNCVGMGTIAGGAGADWISAPSAVRGFGLFGCIGKEGNVSTKYPN